MSMMLGSISIFIGRKTSSPVWLCQGVVSIFYHCQVCLLSVVLIVCISLCHPEFDHLVKDRKIVFLQNLSSCGVPLISSVLQWKMDTTRISRLLWFGPDFDSASAHVTVIVHCYFIFIKFILLPHEFASSVPPKWVPVHHLCQLPECALLWQV